MYQLFLSYWPYNPRGLLKWGTYNYKPTFSLSHVKKRNVLYNHKIQIKRNPLKNKFLGIPSFSLFNWKTHSYTITSTLILHFSLPKLPLRWKEVGFGHPKRIPKRKFSESITQGASAIREVDTCIVKSIKGEVLKLRK